MEPSHLRILPPSPGSPSLTLYCKMGLCNRLKVLVSGLALAEATGRSFTMLWPRTADCGATFDELFSNAWPVYTVDLADLNTIVDLDTFHPNWPNLLTSDTPELRYGANNWLLLPKQYPAHARLWPRAAEFLENLTPIPAIQAQIEQIRQNFRPTMIGVHARRGDFLRFIPTVAHNTDVIMAAVDKRLTEHPDAGIFLTSDDGAPDVITRRQDFEGVHAKFRTRYGDRLLWHTARTLDREEATAIQDALVDIWLLRQTHFFIGTRASSFSVIAHFGRDIPSELLGAPANWHVRLQQVARVTGIYGLMKQWQRRHGDAYGPSHLFNLFWERFSYWRNTLWRSISWRKSSLGE